MHPKPSAQVRRNLLAGMIGFALIAGLALITTLAVSAQPLDRPRFDPPWVADVAITRPEDTPAGPPAVAASGDNVWAAWAENDRPYLASSTSAGATWSTPAAVTTHTLGLWGQGPVLAALSPSTVEVAWYTWNYYSDEAIYFKRSTDGGQTWGPNRVVRGPTGLIDLKTMALAAGPDGRALIAWRTTNTIMAAGSANDGDTWSPPVQVRNAWVADRPAVAFAPAGSAHLVWIENQYGLPTHVFYARSADTGATWTSPIDISQAPTYTQTQPSIAVDAATGDIHVVWAESRPAGSGLYHTASTDGGLTWSTPHLISGAGGPASEPAITAWTSGVVYTVWQDGRFGQPDILFTRSSDRGLTWSGVGRVNTEGTNAHLHPALAAGSSLYPVWQDNRNGKNDIFTTRLNTSCAIPLTSVNIQGAASVLPGATLVLTGTFTPANASGPISFTWSPAPATGQGTLLSAYQWSEPNFYTVTFGAANCGGAFAAELPVTVMCSDPVGRVFLDGPNALAAGETGVFTATTSPASPYQPVTYQWSPSPLSGQGSAVAAYRWQDVGVHTLTATVWNCSGAWGMPNSTKAVPVSDSVAPAWGTLTPAGWITTTQSPALAIPVWDNESGLNPASGQYQYTLDGASTWSTWADMATSGAEYATTTQAIAVTIPWNQDSGSTHRNRVRFRAADMAGNQSASADYNVDIDTAAPTQPASVSGDRTTGTWSNVAAIQMTWSGGSDAASGVRYLYYWDQNATTVPLPAWASVTSASTLSTTLPGDGKWYFHLRAVDVAGNLASGAVHAGPYWLDATPPAKPVVYSTSPVTSTWTANRPVYVSYGGSSDPGGSGPAGYSFEWSSSPTTTPDTTLDPNTSLFTLPDGIWYFHVWAKDNAGNWTPVTHAGPIWLDLPPTAPTGLYGTPLTNTWVNSGGISVTWSAATDDAGIAGYATRWDWGTPQSPDCLVTTTALTATRPAVTQGHWWFSVRARNVNGLCSQAANIGPFLIDTTPPTNPLSLNGWKSNATTVEVYWGNAFDAESGVAGYNYTWGTSKDVWLGTSNPTPALSATIPNLSDDSWYFFLRTIDVAGNGSELTSLGPFLIDTTPPDNPWSFAANHPLNTPTSDAITVTWEAGYDYGGSGVAGYSVLWSEAADTLPPIANPTTEQFSMRVLPSGQNHWIHVRTRDKFGNWSPTAAHYGPFWISNSRPTCSVTAPARVNVRNFNINWSGKGGLPILNYDVEWRRAYAAPGGWTSLISGQPDTTKLVLGEHGAVYDFRCRARDAVGFGEWSSYTTTRVETVDLVALGLEVTQGPQDLANHVALVTNKHTYARLHVSSGLLDFNEAVNAKLEVWSDGAYMGTLTPINDWHGLKASPDRGLLNDGFTFELPTQWTDAGHLWLVAQVDPGGRIAESNYANNIVQVWPYMVNTGQLCLVMSSYIPNVANPDANTIYTLDDPGFWDIIQNARRFLPVSIGNAGLRIYKGASVGSGIGFLSYDLSTDGGWSGLLAAIASVDDNTTNPCADTHYYGMISENTPVKQPPGFASEGLGRRPGTAAIGLMRSAVRGDRVPPGRRGGLILAHELGHNFGRLHVWCQGTEGDPDPNYPYQSFAPKCQIGKVDAWGQSKQDSFYTTFQPYSGTLPVIVPPVGFGDLMSYDWGVGISDYTYNAFMANIGWLPAASANVMAADAGSVGWSSAGDYLTVSGMITPTAGTARFYPFYRKADAKPSRLQASYAQTLIDGAPYSITMEAADGTLLYTYPFSPSVSMDGIHPSDLPTSIDFSLTFPYHPDTAAIRLYDQGQVLVTRTVSAHAPVVNLVSPTGGETFTKTLTVRWSGSDEDGDTLTYIVRYSPDGGATWSAIGVDTSATRLTISDTTALAGSAQAIVQVIASDGLNTTPVTSTQFNLARHAPEAHILTPVANDRYLPGAVIDFEAAAMDAEDGWIDSSAQITWTSDVSGTLGTGALLSVTTLPAGTHHVTVNVRDSDGMTATAVVTVFIDSPTKRLFLPLVVR